MRPAAADLLVLALLASAASAGEAAPPSTPPPASPPVASTPPASDPGVAGADDFARRRAALAPGDHDGAVALARQAIEDGRLDDADDLLRGVLAEDPHHDDAFYLLWELNRGRDLPRASEALAAARALLPDTFRPYPTSHFVILSDADSSWVHRQGERLERAYDRFVRFALGLELRALPLRHKLVAVAFSRHRDFMRLARADGSPTGARIAGYYSRPADRLVFYHVESDENVAEARLQLEEMWAEAEAIHHASRRARSTGRREEGRDLQERYDEHARQLSEQEQRLNTFALQQSVSVTVHEAIHQLMFHTAVQSPAAHHPMWLTEGLATAFETDDPRSDFGPGREYAPRREAFENVLDEGRLIPLRRLVTLTESVFDSDPGAVGAVYAESYALVTWMYRERRRELRDYIQALNDLPPGRQTPEKHLAVFEQCFGEADGVEEAWIKRERD